MDCYKTRSQGMKKGGAMRSGALRMCTWTFAAFTVVVSPACGSGDEDPNGGRSNSTTPEVPEDKPTTPTTPEEQIQKILDQRKTDFGEALRTASLKLRDRLPDLAATGRRA